MNISLFVMLILFRYMNDYCCGCDVGYYGQSCSDSCPDNCHDNECNVTTGKCLSCVKGHYSDYKKDCRECPKHCTACNSDKFCFACNSGFRGEVCEDNCTNCRPYTSCDKNTGYCFENCSEGLSGELCNIQCDSKCKSCDRNNKGECIYCADDENGNSCKEECFNKCLGNTCYESHGSCAEECLSGYMTDKTCNRTCLSHCKDRCKFRCKELVPQNKTSSSTSKTNIDLIVGLVIGSFAVCVCIAIYIVVRRRYIKRSYCCLNSSDGTHDPDRTSIIHDDENIELLSVEAKPTTKTRELASADKLAVLQLQGTIIAIQEKYGNMKIIVDKKNVTVEGDPLDIETAFKEIDIKCDEIEQMGYKHSKSREWLIFFQKEQIEKYVKKKLEQKQLFGIWNINDTELNVFVHGKGNSKNFKNTLLESVIEMPALDKESLFSSIWRDEFLLNIHRIFQEKVDLFNIFNQDQQDMVIICTDDVVKQVTQIVSEFLDGNTDEIQCESLVCEFVSKYWTLDDFDEIREGGVLIITEANRIKLRGFLENVTKCKEKLNMKLKDICSKQHVLKGTGMITVLKAAKHSGTISDIEKEYRCVIKLPSEIDKSPTAMLSDSADIGSQILENPQDSSTNAPTTCFQTRRHNMKIHLIQGDISHQKADIIVKEAASNLDLQCGSAFSTSLKQSSSELQTDYNRRCPSGIQNVEVAVVVSSDLNKIYLTSLPPWKEASRDGGIVFRNFIRECLRLANKFDMNSIAFGIMVTVKKLGYPTDTAISIAIGAVVEFESSYSNTSLQDISIGIPYEDDENIKAYLMCHFKRHEKDTRTNRNFIQDGTILTQPYDKSKYRMVKDGCAIGPINLQVLIGNLLDYTADVIVLGVRANTETKEPVLEKNKVVIQESTGVKAKYVIHVMLQDTLAGWRSKLIECLEEACKKSINSVALSVLGSGVEPQTFSADGIGHCLFAAIDDFTSQNPTLRVTNVILVVPGSYAGCMPAIVATWQDRITAVNSQHGICKIFKSQLGFEAESRIFKESSVTVCSNSTTNFDRCIKALDDRIGLVFAKKVVDVDKDVIDSLKDKQISSIIDLDIIVDVTFDKKAGQYTICGPLRNVLAASACLHNKMRQYKRKENNRVSAKVLFDQTRWHWLDQMTSVKEFPYDMMTNFIIETAYKARTQTVELQSKDGKIYVIDIEKLVEYLKLNVNDTVMVIRREILNPGMLKDFKLDVKKRFSKSWAAMKNNEDVTRVTLDDGKEYQKVKKLFLDEENNKDSTKDTCRSFQVVKIERIQNKTLYEQYQVKKMMMKHQKGRKLWHETAEDYSHWITNNGFNRSYCRFQGVMFGQGVYFAVDPSTAAQSFLPGNKPGAKRYMFLAKVLTGELINGNPSMRVLPLVDPAKPTIVYDSAVDDVNNPMRFVIFHDKQAYPEYLITYTSN